MQIRSDRSHHFDRSAAEVWEALTRTDDYRSWWPWLRRLDGAAMEAGAEWECTVQPPLPYVLRFAIAIDEVDEALRVTASVHGDIRGTAELTLSETDAGCDVRLASVLEPANRGLQVISTLAPPVARFGHDWIVRTGVDQFRRQAW
ncbi:SRPBCC family protein [Actinospongicola halichondriae]|uniref:SRPBCC family protein n=1 Tax=Actinospongicola halichondriae TaxID=3236844 RepID=UPI003D5C6FA6